MTCLGAQKQILTYTESYCGTCTIIIYSKFLLMKTCAKLYSKLVCIKFKHIVQGVFKRLQASFKNKYNIVSVRSF